jgi:myo-inositol-1(or 4)-monophosphatase
VRWKRRPEFGIWRRLGLVLEELDCPIRWLGADPSRLMPGEDLSQAPFPMLAAASVPQLNRLVAMG